ncbi:M23 family metallopeptidase [Pseudactinotalea sp. Z1732]|uniref:M23 family metallopeptidase n=1 Tax=Pseudactinotalea sp. Z1732 TaxID=3413026 RepID=UPI003C7C6ED4
MRLISALRPVWAGLLLAAFIAVGLIVLNSFIPEQPLPLRPRHALFVSGLIVVLLVLIGTAPRTSPGAPAELLAPVRGQWVAMNSPGQHLPSHGTRTRGQYCAVDLSRPARDSTPALVRWGLRGDRPEEYPSFGEPVYAMAPGVVVRSLGSRRDHRARSTWPGLVYLATVEAMAREIGGTGAVLGNHVIVAHDDGTFAAYAHLRRGSAIALGSSVVAGDVIGRVGNTGNTSMPHLHVQLMDRANVEAAAGLTMVWPQIARTGDLDPTFVKYAREPTSAALSQMPRDGEVFTAPETPPAA